LASAGHSAQILEMLDAQGPAVARQLVAKDVVAAFADGFGQLRLQFEGSPPHALALGCSQQAPQQCRLAASRAALKRHRPRHVVRKCGEDRGRELSFGRHQGFDSMPPSPR
jgi:hypothetical protein